MIMTISSIVVTQVDEQKTNQQRLYQRMEYISKAIKTKTLQREKGSKGDLKCHDTAEPSCCSICLEDFVPGETVCESPNCKHIFHLEGCMAEWLLRNDHCPCCRVSFLAPIAKGYVRPISQKVPVLPNTMPVRVTPPQMHVLPTSMMLNSMDEMPPWMVFVGN